MPDIAIDGYKEYDVALPISRTTLRLRTHDLDGFTKYVGDNMMQIVYEEREDGKLSMRTSANGKQKL